MIRAFLFIALLVFFSCDTPEEKDQLGSTLTYRKVDRNNIVVGLEGRWVDTFNFKLNPYSPSYEVNYFIDSNQRCIYINFYSDGIYKLALNNGELLSKHLLDHTGAYMEDTNATLEMLDDKILFYARSEFYIFDKNLAQLYNSNDFIMSKIQSEEYMALYIDSIRHRVEGNGRFLIDYHCAIGDTPPYPKVFLVDTLDI